MASASATKAQLGLALDGATGQQRFDRPLVEIVKGCGTVLARPVIA